MTELEKNNGTPETEKNVHAMSKEELLRELRDIVSERRLNSHKDVTAIKQSLFALRQKEINDELNAFVEAGNAPETFSASVDEAENEAKELMATFRELRNQFLLEEEKRMAENLEKKRAVIVEMTAIVEDADNVNVNYNKFQELIQQFKELGDVTPAAETEIWKSFNKVREDFYDTLKANKELRELDFKKNLEAKRRLIAETLALQAEESINEGARKLQMLRDEWREIGPVVKDLRESIWEEFKTAAAMISAKHQEFYEGRKAAEKENEEAKAKLCAEAEAIETDGLDTSAAWEEATSKIKGLQAQWKEIGFASRKANAELFGRFRKSCDAFFEAKSKYMEGVKARLLENLDKKIALCEKAEALGDAEELRNNLDAVIKLQAEWKTIGSVPRKESDNVWQRFTKACNKVFDDHKKRTNALRNEQNANLEAKRAIIAKLKEIPLDVDRNEGLKLVKDLQNQYQAIGHVPFKQKDKVYAEYREVCDALYGAFSRGRDNERRRNYESRLEDIKGDERKVRSEKERLQRVIEQKQQELRTYANNLGFFNVKSSQGNSLFKDMERKMQRIEDDIRDLRSKIALLDAETNPDA